MMKTCSKCNVDQPLAGFVKKASSPDGYATACKACRKVSSAKYRSENQDKIIAARAKDYIKNAEKYKARTIQWRKDNKEASKLYYREYRKANLDRTNAYKSAHRAAKLNATPKWLTAEQKEQIVEFYSIAKRLEAKTGDKYHVDHIIPLNGEYVRGLHVPWNLQVLTASENMSKSNRYDPKNNSRHATSFTQG